MGKKFYVILFSALVISLMLLGFSFSKESGSNDVTEMIEVKNNDYRVVFSNNQRIDTASNNAIDISIVNKNTTKKSFYLYLREVNERKYDNVYYSLNNDEKMLLNGNVINLGELSIFGEDGDMGNYKLEISTDSDSKYEFKIEVIDYEKDNLSGKIINGGNVYQDIGGNLRYFGEDVNNYIKYSEEVYRIVGFVDRKIMIIGDAEKLSTYDGEGNTYLTLDNYVKSFSYSSKITVSDILGKNSWLLNDKEYWLLESNADTATYTSLDRGVLSTNKTDNKYVRNVYEISDFPVVGGDGSLENPYEVSYGN